MAVKLTNRADADIIDIYLQSARTFGQHQAESYHAGLSATLGRL
jgi:plasmid stabilization system protein ParE